jgi:hypothetical protein
MEFWSESFHINLTRWQSTETGRVVWVCQLTRDNQAFTAEGNTGVSAMFRAYD